MNVRQRLHFCYRPLHQRKVPRAVNIHESCDYFVIERIRDLPRRTLDEAARRRRLRRALDALEADNFQDDPHSDLKMSKKAPKFEESLGGSLIWLFDELQCEHFV